MLKTVGQLIQLVIAQIQIHQAGDESKLRHKAIIQEIERHIQILQTLKPSFL